MNPPLENPFLAVGAEVERLKSEEGAQVIFLDFHAETTSEKIAMGRFLDGKVAGVIGTHTHVQTARRANFSPAGTAFLCDAGMCGAQESILGRRIDPIVERMLTSTPRTMPVAKGAVLLCGAQIDIDVETGLAVKIERISELVPAASQNSADTANPPPAEDPAEDE